jgi:hypothetical protein
MMKKTKFSLNMRRIRRLFVMYEDVQGTFSLSGYEL